DGRSRRLPPRPGVRPETSLQHRLPPDLERHRRRGRDPGSLPEVVPQLPAIRPGPALPPLVPPTGDQLRPELEGEEAADVGAARSDRGPRPRPGRLQREAPPGDPGAPLGVPG